VIVPALSVRTRSRLKDDEIWPAICCASLMSRPRAISVPATGLRLRVVRNRAGDRLLFGHPVVTYAFHEGGALLLFDAGQVFGIVRWRGDGYGTQTWRVVVARALVAGEQGTAVPGLEPGGEVLLHAFGKVRAKRALRAIDGLCDRHVLHEIAPAYWRHIHLCVGQGVAPDPYDEAAFRLRADVGISP
jgi:hypothetical protein